MFSGHPCMYLNVVSLYKKVKSIFVVNELEKEKNLSRSYKFLSY